MGDPTLLGPAPWAVCGRCGGRLSGNRNAEGRYLCRDARRGGSSCPGISISMTRTDDLIPRAVWERALTLDPTEPEDLLQLRAVAKRFNKAQPSDADAASRRAAETAVADALASLEDLDTDRAAGAFPGDAGRTRYLRITWAGEAAEEDF